MVMSFACLLYLSSHILLKQTYLQVCSILHTSSFNWARGVLTQPGSDIVMFYLAVFPQSQHLILTWA